MRSCDHHDGISRKVVKLQVVVFAGIRGKAAEYGKANRHRTA